MVDELSSSTPADAAVVVERKVGTFGSRDRLVQQQMKKVDCLDG